VDKLLERPSFKAIVFLLGVGITSVFALLPFAHAYIVKDIESSVTTKVHKLENDILALSAKTDLNHQLLMQEFKLFKEEITKKVR